MQLRRIEVHSLEAGPHGLGNGPCKRAPEPSAVEPQGAQLGAPHDRQCLPALLAQRDAHAKLLEQREHCVRKRSQPSRRNGITKSERF